MLNIKDGTTSFDEISKTRHLSSRPLFSSPTKLSDKERKRNPNNNLSLKSQKRSDLSLLSRSLSLLTCREETRRGGFSLSKIISLFPRIFPLFMSSQVADSHPGLLLPQTLVSETSSPLDLSLNQITCMCRI